MNEWDEDYCSNCGSQVEFEQNPQNAHWPMEYKCDRCGQNANENGEIYNEGGEQ